MKLFTEENVTPEEIKGAVQVLIDTIYKIRMDLIFNCEEIDKNNTNKKVDYLFLQLSGELELAQGIAMQLIMALDEDV